ncbi:uncharacterized protein LOC106651160 [Trichogramma pretiosum]|uniref:uncharacterized protein LOC106651160 n=1 Tax=Trichogramma pretiosum TaxID=7493 RepID=UPI0006C9BC99|nr:uncharacterized protein LOC106651160 [Trichogramma pretiosum]
MPSVARAESVTAIVKKFAPPFSNVHALLEVTCFISKVSLHHRTNNMENSWAAVHLFGHCNAEKLQYVEIKKVKNYFEGKEEGQKSFMIEVVNKNGKEIDAIGEVLYLGASEEAVKSLVAAKRPKITNKRRSEAETEHSNYMEKKRKLDGKLLKDKKINVNSCDDDVESLTNNEESDSKSIEMEESDVTKVKKSKRSKLTQEELQFKNNLKVYDNKVNKSILDNYKLIRGEKENSPSTMNKANGLEDPESLSEKIMKAERLLASLKSQLHSQSSPSKARKKLFVGSEENSVGGKQISNQNTEPAFSNSQRESLLGKDSDDDLDGVRWQFSQSKHNIMAFTPPIPNTNGKDPGKSLLDSNEKLSDSILLSDYDYDPQTASTDFQVDKLKSSLSTKNILKSPKKTMQRSSLCDNEEPDMINKSKEEIKSKKAKKAKKKTKKVNYDPKLFKELEADYGDKFKVFTEKDPITNLEVEKIHLMCGVVINYEDWEAIPSPRDITPSLYVRKLCDAIWGEDAFANRAMQVKQVTRHIPGRSPKHQITPQKAAAVNGCYQKFLRLKYPIKSDLPPKKKKYNTKKIQENEKLWTRFISQYINQLTKTLIEQTKSDDSSDKTASSTSDSEKTSGSASDSDSSSSSE